MEEEIEYGRGLLLTEINPTDTMKVQKEEEKNKKNREREREKS
jgi:hypothetical protein